jgi:hypothetical protein
VSPKIAVEMLFVGAAVGLLLGLSGLARAIGRAAAGVVALVAIWILLREGPQALVYQAQALVKVSGGNADFLLGIVGGLLVGGAIGRERQHPERW